MLINTERMAFLAVNSFHKYRELFFSTFKLSACTFGGGFVIIPLMRKKFVEELGWVEEDEMMDLTAIAQSSPGAIAVNASILVGYHVAGFPSAMLTVLGTVLPPLIIISIISMFYQAFRDNAVVNMAMAGMLCGVAAGSGLIFPRNQSRGLPSHLAELRRRQKDISSRTAVSDAEAVWQYVRRAASDRAVFRSGSSRNIACTVEIA